MIFQYRDQKISSKILAEIDRADSKGLTIETIRMSLPEFVAFLDEGVVPGNKEAMMASGKATFWGIDIRLDNDRGV